MPGKGKVTAKTPPSFASMVRDNGPITLGAARAYARKLPANQQKHPCCACYRVRCPTNGCCCKGKCVGLSCHLTLGSCLWYCWPWMCACTDTDNPGTYSCSDLKGNTYNLVNVLEGKKWALFTENVFMTSKGDDLEAGCYCEE